MRGSSLRLLAQSRHSPFVPPQARFDPNRHSGVSRSCGTCFGIPACAQETSLNELRVQYVLARTRGDFSCSQSARFGACLSRINPRRKSGTVHVIAWRVARNSFFVLCSFLLGALILEFSGMSIPVLRVSGGLIVAGADENFERWQSKGIGCFGRSFRAPIRSTTHSPLTLPLTTGPGTIAG